MVASERSSSVVHTSLCLDGGGIGAMESLDNGRSNAKMYHPY